MKLLMLMYLEEDDRCVARLLREHDVDVFSRLDMEGSGPGSRGWYGEPAPYRSRMAFTLVSDATAEALLDAVAACEDVEDPRHPIRAVQLAVERTTACECGPNGGGAGKTDARRLDRKEADR